MKAKLTTAKVIVQDWTGRRNKKGEYSKRSIPVGINDGLEFTINGTTVLVIWGDGHIQYWSKIDKSKFKKV